MMDDTTAFCMKSTSTGTGTGTKCGRWNPTSEQVKVLTELFMSGLRTPSTDQIQKISSQLSFYGKIESKNVFYWFQNHKARERQKRRKLVSSPSSDENHNHNQNLNRIGFEFFKSSPSHNLSSHKRVLDYNNNDQDYEEHQQERVLETLQLFPLNSIEEESETEKLRSSSSVHANYQETMPFSYTMDHHPPLDLRLSFL